MTNDEVDSQTELFTTFINEVLDSVGRVSFLKIIKSRLQNDYEYSFQIENSELFWPCHATYVTVNNKEIFTFTIPNMINPDAYKSFQVCGNGPFMLLDTDDNQEDHWYQFVLQDLDNYVLNVLQIRRDDRPSYRVTILINKPHEKLRIIVEKRNGTYALELAFQPGVPCQQ